MQHRRISSIFAMGAMLLVSACNCDDLEKALNNATTALGNAISGTLSTDKQGNQKLNFGLSGNSGIMNAPGQVDYDSKEGVAIKKIQAQEQAAIDKVMADAQAYGDQVEAMIGLPNPGNNGKILTQKQAKMLKQNYWNMALAQVKNLANTAMQNEDKVEQNYQKYRQTAIDNATKAIAAADKADDECTDELGERTKLLKMANDTVAGWQTTSDTYADNLLGKTVDVPVVDPITGKPKLDKNGNPVTAPERQGGVFETWYNGIILSAPQQLKTALAYSGPISYILDGQTEIASCDDASGYCDFM